MNQSSDVKTQHFYSYFMQMVANSINFGVPVRVINRSRLKERKDGESALCLHCRIIVASRDDEIYVASA
jgi:hypothetical protein